MAKGPCQVLALIIDKRHHGQRALSGVSTHHRQGLYCTRGESKLTRFRPLNTIRSLLAWETEQYGTCPPTARN